MVATALTVHGIETQQEYLLKTSIQYHVATALTVHGIETRYHP